MRNQPDGGKTESVTVQETNDASSTEQTITTLPIKESTAETSLMGSAKMTPTMKSTTAVLGITESPDN